jgi:hypothetical protein
MVKNQARQGDLLFIKIKTLPTGTTKAKDNVLAYGEVTGHHHTAEGDGVCVMENDTGQKFVSSSQPWTATHQEHAHIAFDGGVWEVRRQREYQPDAIRTVQD